MGINVLAAGLALPQDAGRMGYAEVGVSRSGAFNRDDYRLLGSLMGYPNDYSYPAIELLGGSLNLRSTTNTTFAVLGRCRIEVNGVLLPSETVLDVNEGDHLYIQLLDSNPAYVAFDGLTFSKVLDSISFDSMSLLGNAPLRSGDVLLINPEAKGHARVGQFLLLKRSLTSSAVKTLNILAGPHDGVEILTGRTWKIDALARSGIRLIPDSQNPYTAEELLLIKSGGALKSLPVTPGAIQLPVSGNPIILGPDSGVTGGYLVPAVLATFDLHKLASLSNGDNIKFKRITQAEAMLSYASAQKALENKVIQAHNIV